MENRYKPSTVYQIQTRYNSGSKLSDKKCIFKDLQSQIKTHKKKYKISDLNSLDKRKSKDT